MQTQCHVFPDMEHRYDSGGVQPPSCRSGATVLYSSQFPVNLSELLRRYGHGLIMKCFVLYRFRHGIAFRRAEGE